MATVKRRFDLCVSETYKSGNEEKTISRKVGDGVEFESGVIKIRRFDGNVEYTLFERKEEKKDSKKEDLPFDI